MNIYLICIVVLFTLAVIDLIVGVSNDAVNFLNSAIGARVAKLRTIFIVAAAGIFIGAATSGGMMDIARHGIFHPEMFSFKEIMTIFLAVVISDVLLLDIFNNLGMPTSTTVSMVFELLGGTTAFALIKMTGGDGSLGIGDYMNTEKALEIIFSIFLSVALAFVFGAIVQYISRLVFTFTYKKHLKWKIGIFGGIAATAIIYFMLFKGVKGMSFMTPESVAFINDNTVPLLAGCFVVSTILMQCLHFLKVDVFKVLVLLGTFALAMAFAGNDLVNFIGVSMAGLSSYQDFMAHPGADASVFMMDSLNESAKTPIFFLLAAGAIMVIALFTSKKSRAVIKTSVDLSRQGDGDEMFGSSKLARSLVRFSTSVGSFFDDIIPERVKVWSNKRFNTSEIQLEDGAAFDGVRATVNLVVASLLIALGTSLKLPLSTTYVTFMVAMGTSLADKAWGRETAVYRITGVVSVIGGWFITAGAAFLLAFCMAMLINFGGVVAAVILVSLVAFIMIKSMIKAHSKTKPEVSDELYTEMSKATDKQEIESLLEKHIALSEADFVAYAKETYKQISDGFIEENLSMLRKSDKSMRRMREQLKGTRRKEMVTLRRIDPEAAMRLNTWFHLGRNSCDNMLYCLRRIEEPCEEHVDNGFPPLNQDQLRDFVPLRDSVLYLADRTVKIFTQHDYESIPEVRAEGAKLKKTLEHARDLQIERMQRSGENLTLAYLYLNILQESREFASHMRHLLRSAQGLWEKQPGVFDDED